MIKAIIEHKNEGTVEIALPQSIRGMAEKLLSVGISKKPHDIRVSDTEKDDIRVRFTSDDTVGTHLIRLFNERCSLEDANETQLAIQNTTVDVQERINEKLLSDKYTSIKQIPENIKQWSYICDDDMDCLFTARLQCENESTYIHLPCDDLQKAAETINAPDIGSCDVRLTDFNIGCDEAVEMFEDIFQKEGLQGVNTLAKATGGFDDYEFEKLIAVVEYAGVSDSGSVCKLAENLDRIEVVDDVIDYEDLARYWIDINEEYSLSSDMEDYHALNLHSVFSKGTIEFRMFNSTLHAGEVKTYIQLCLAISHQALIQHGASRSKTKTDNEKYTFRTWLLRLGLIGDEFKTARHHLLKNLDGNIAWKDPAQAEKQKERLAAKREQGLAQTQQETAPVQEPEETNEQEQETSAFSMRMR